MFRRKKAAGTTLKKPRVSRSYEIDGKKYPSTALVAYHRELSLLRELGIIKSFKLPEVSDVSYSKFKSYKAIINDIQFDSINESRYYLKLLDEKRRGIVKKFELQKEFELVPAYEKNGKKIRKMSYIADFVVQLADNSIQVIDVKGIETDVFKLKKKLFEYRYRNLSLICCRYVAKDRCWKTLDEIAAEKKSKTKATKVAKKSTKSTKSTKTTKTTKTKKTSKISKKSK